MYEENEKLRLDLSKWSEKFDEWSGSEMTYTQLINQKSDIEKELKKYIETMANEENLKEMDKKRIAR